MRAPPTHDITVPPMRALLRGTGCTASAGIGPNKMLARLATRKGKPNGQFRVRAQEAAAFVRGLGVRDLHGVGRSAQHRLAAHGIETVDQLQA